MYVVYVLKSNTSGRIYIGQTENIEKRLKQHNDQSFDKRSFTKLAGKNWGLRYKEQFVTRKEALKREKYLKSHIGRDWLKITLGPIAQW